MKSKHLFIALAAMMLLGATMPAQAQNKKKKAKPTATQVNITVPGELGIYELRGPVKECKWIKSYETVTYGFDTNGKWITKDGQRLTEFYGNNIKRDSKGRITMLGDVEENTKYHYNANGLITKFEQHFMDGRYEVSYTYNNNGECTKCVNKGSDMEGSFKNTVKFTILERDSYGNWTKRKDNQGGSETRTITYY